MMDPACRSRCLLSPQHADIIVHTGAAGGAVAAAVMLNTPNPLLYRKEGGGDFHTHTHTKKKSRACTRMCRVWMCVCI